MKIYKHILPCVSAAALFISFPSFAQDLSDEEAYSRAYTVCSQKVFPLWRPKEGETVNKDNYARTPARLKIIAECMRDKGVPASYSEETEGIVRTGAGFGQNVDIKIEDLFPADIETPQENPHKTDQNILPDPDYSRADNPPAAMDSVDATIIENERRRGGAAMTGGREPAQSAPERPASNRPEVRSGNIGVITGNDNNEGSDGGAKPIFLPR